jgi:uncharacterized repeat protein (TIGR02543 family)
MYAQWQITDYAITYYLDGGTNAGANPAGYTVAELPVSLAAPSRPGYAFGGWHDNAGFNGAALASIPANSTGDKSFYAKWTANTYTVVYDKNAGDATGATASSAHTYDQTAALTANGFARTGYAFEGWAASSGGGVTYTDGQDVTNLSSAGGATITLYARWTAIQYIITYNLDGGTNNAANPTSYTIASGTITLSAPTRAGYQFGGWHSDAAFNLPAAGIPANSTGNKTFYAQWKPGAPVQITLQPVPGDPPLSNTSLFEDESAQFSAAGTGYASWQWHWDGAVISSGGNSDAYTLAANTQAPGIYELSVTVTTTGSGELLSARCRVTIKAR